MTDADQGLEEIKIESSESDLKKADEDQDPKKQVQKAPSVGCATYQDMECVITVPEFKKNYRSHGVPVYGTIRNVVGEKVLDLYMAYMNQCTTWVYPR